MTTLFRFKFSFAPLLLSQGVELIIENKPADFADTSF